MTKHTTASPPKAGECACTMLKKASRAMTRFYEEAMAPAGVTATQFAILRALERNGPTPLSRLAEELVMDRTSLYRALSPLLRDALLVTKASSVDRRVKEAALSRAGHRRIARALPYWRSAQDDFLADFGTRDWSGTAGSLAKLVALVPSSRKSTRIP